MTGNTHNTATAAKAKNIGLPEGITLGHYKLLHVLGQGGFGITYLAVDQRSNAQVVIKENLPTFYAVRDEASLQVQPLAVADAMQNYTHTLQRFVEEARILAHLNHPNIVRVHEAFEALGTAYYVMPYIEAKELHKVIPTEAVDEAWLLPILKAVLSARFSPALLSSIDKALAIRAKDRWQSAQEWTAALAAPPTPRVTRPSAPLPTEQTTEAPATNSGKKPLTRLLCLLAALLLGGGYGVDAVEQERLQAEYALTEAQCIAQEQAERLAREEAERLAREEAQRIAENENILTQKAWVDFCTANFVAGNEFSGEWTRDGQFGPLTLKIENATVFENAIHFYGFLYDTKLPQASISIAGRCSMVREEDGSSKVDVKLYDGAYDPDEPTAEVYDAEDGCLTLKLSKYGELIGIMTRASWTETSEKKFALHLVTCDKSGKPQKEETQDQKEWNDLCAASFAEGRKFSGKWSRDGKLGELTLKVETATILENSIHFYGILYDTKRPKASISISGRCSLERDAKGTSKVNISLYDGAYAPDEPTAEVYDAPDGCLILEFGEHGVLKGIMTRTSWTETPERSFSIDMTIQKKD